MYGQELESAINGYNFQKAVAIIDTLLSDNPTLDSAKVRSLSLQKVKCLKKLYKYNDAITTISSLMGPAPDNELLNELAECHTLNGNLEDAVSCYSLLSITNPDNLYYQIQKCGLLYKMDNYNEAIDIGKEIIAKDSIPAIVSIVANSYNLADQPDSAVVYYYKLLSLTPFNDKVISKLSNLLLLDKQYDTVINLTQQYLEQDSTNLIINPIYGLALHLKGNYPLSHEVFTKQLELDGDSFMTYYYLGMNNFLMNNMFKAEKEFEKAYLIDSLNVNVIYHLAYSKGWQKYKFDEEAKRLYDKALSMLQPDSLMVSKIYTGYAVAYFGSRQYKDAITYYKLGYQYDNTSITNLSTIGYCYKQLKDYKSAIDYYKRFLSKAKPGTKSYQFVEKSIELVNGKLFMEEPPEPKAVKK
ncbi:MAG: tetratricopeptide repeat protein [Bacteroidales bacterium]|nr:tetratricopeptide repeat protein [Eubacteriales bacterium]MDD4670013.1 tetratricopeptide repeat protein [Bacteroidales bacterium]